jgi:hypothetical protein
MRDHPGTRRQQQRPGVAKRNIVVKDDIAPARGFDEGAGGWTAKHFKWKIAGLFLFSFCVGDKANLVSAPLEFQSQSPAHFLQAADARPKRIADKQNLQCVGAPNDAGEGPLSSRSIFLAGFLGQQ